MWLLAVIAVVQVFDLLLKLVRFSKDYNQELQEEMSEEAKRMFA
jgi:cell division protein ZapA (FtsZ GTPase activity inhibitor)